MELFGNKIVFKKKYFSANLELVLISGDTQNERNLQIDYTLLN
jgi:hypothetical protein